MKMFFKITRLHTRLNKNKNKIWINAKVFKIILKIMLLFEKCVFQFSVNRILLQLFLLENNLKSIRMKKLFEMMSLHCVPYILYWIQAEWKLYIQTYCQIIWVYFTNMVAIIFFHTDVHIWLTTLSPCLHLSTFFPTPSPLPLMFRHPLWMGPLMNMYQTYAKKSSKK